MNIFKFWIYKINQSQLTEKIDVATDNDTISSTQKYIE